jgi:hypothetical protein
MRIKTQFLKHKKKWTAFITYQGYDYYELGNTEQEAIDNLIALHPQLKPYR